MKQLLIILAMLCTANAYGQGPVISADVVSNAKTNVFIHNAKLITAYESTTNKTWRFIHDGKRLITTPFPTDGVTTTPNKVVECKSWTIATNEIAKMALKLTPEQAEQIAEGEPQNTEPSGPSKKVDVVTR